MPPDAAAPVPVGWIPREPPLPPEAAVGLGAAAHALKQALLTRKDLADLRGVWAPDLLVVLGPANALPWADGVLYLGRHPEAPGILLPTLQRPDVPLDLFARAVLARVAPAPGPIAVLPPRRLVPLGGARPIDARLLAEALA